MKSLQALSFLQVCPSSTACLSSSRQRWGYVVNGISIFATKYAMSKSFSSFKATSLLSCLNAHGMTASCGLAAIWMASAALWCPTDPAWLLGESNLKFAQPPETNAEDESDKLGLSSHTEHNIVPSLLYTHGQSVFHAGKNFCFDWETFPSSLGFL